MKSKYSYLVFVVILFLAFLTVGCKNEYKKVGKTDMKYKTYEEFKKSAGGFPYTAPEAKKNNLLNNYSKLSLGMTRQQVYDILGEPDVETEILPKFTFETPKSRGWYWRYYIYKSDKWGQNIKLDKQVNVFYDVNGKADWISADNIERLQELGGPENKTIFMGRFDSKTGERLDK